MKADWVNSPLSEGTAPGHQAPRDFSQVLGFSLFITLSSISAWGLITPLSMSWVNSTWIVTYETVRSVSFICTLLVFGMGCLHLNPSFIVNTSKPAAALWVLGYLFLFIPAFFDIGHGWPIGIAAVFLGIAHALSFIVWVRLFDSCDKRASSRQIVMGTTLGSIIYLMVSLICNMVEYLFAVMLLILGSSWILNRLARPLFTDDGRRPKTSNEPKKKETARNFISSSWRYALCIATVGYVNAVAHMIVRAGNTNALLFNIFLAIGMFLACVVLLALWEGVHLNLTFRSAYVVIFFTMALGLILLPFLGTDYYAVFAGLANLAFTLVSMFMIITCLRLSQLRAIDSVGAFGLFAAAVYAGFFAGRLTGTSLFGDAIDTSRVLLTVVLCAYGLSFSSVIISMARDARRGAGSHSFDPLDLTDGKAVDTVANDRIAKADETTAPQRETGAAQLSLVITKPSQTTSGKQPCQSSQASRPSGANSILRDAIPSRCQEIRQLYQLSKRETDVLELIVRGRDTAHMAEALFVSENTIKSHCKNLYRKLNVHNRQEIFDLVDELKKATNQHG